MKKIVIAILTITVVIALTSCKQIDVVGNTSIKSFNEVLKTMSKNITADEINSGWSLSAPDGTARFIWSKDYSKSPIHDVMIEFDAKAFLDAGLDVDKLPNGMYYNNKIMVGTKLGNESLAYNGEATPLASYEKIVELNRKSIKYHSVLDHYGIDLSEGNVFEWAKDLNTNDKDIVFVLNPEVFINAGVKPENIKGWAYAKVEIMDENNKKIEVYKILKPFNIK